MFVNVKIISVTESNNIYLINFIKGCVMLCDINIYFYLYIVPMGSLKISYENIYDYLFYLHLSA